MPSDQLFELSTRNDMVHQAPYEPSVRERPEADDDDLGLSESENSVSAEMIRECTPRLQYLRVRCLYSHWLNTFSRVLAKASWNNRSGAPGWLPRFLLSPEADSYFVFPGQRRDLFRLSLSFFLFGMINNGEHPIVYAYWKIFLMVS
jgi:hypothetical protein